MSEFERVLCGITSAEDTLADRVWRLAEDYCKVTEEVDRTVCTGPIIDGAIRPATIQEARESSWFARMAFDNRLWMVEQAGGTRKQFRDAISLYLHRK